MEMAFLKTSLAKYFNLFSQLNLLDKEPPFSNQGTMFQKGYDPRYTDPIGRAYYLRGSYTF